MQPAVYALWDAFSLASAGAVGSLVSAIWQGCVLAAVVALCLRMFPRLSAAARSLVWLNVFLLLILLHVLPAIDGQRAGSSPVHVPRVDLDLRWSIAVAVVWATLSLWRAAQLVAEAIRVHRLAGRAASIEPSPEIQVLLSDGSRRSLLCTSAEVERPSVFGFFRPRILIPPALAEQLTELELRQVVLHEMEHLHRADDWTNLLQKIALVLLPLNPALLWVERRLCAERELACDDRVLLSSGARKAYAICLTRLAEYSMLRRGVSLALGAWERRPELVRRVHRILRRPVESMGKMQARLVTAALMAGVIGGTLVLARSPQLVGFAPANSIAASSATSTEVAAGLASARAFRAVNLRQSVNAPQFVEAKAIMPPTAGSAAPRLQGTRAAAKKAKNRAAPRAARQPNPPRQAWVVLTEFTEDDVQPPAVIPAVFIDSRGTYAAVPLMNGWLIVRI
jgi:beta-lactamase regulating signal transducer with metallopeptidase domain